MGYIINLIGFQTLPVCILISCCLTDWCFKESIDSMDRDRAEAEGEEGGTMLQPLSG